MSELVQLKMKDIFIEGKEKGSNSDELLAVTSKRGIIYQSETGRKNTSADDKSRYKKVYKGDIAYNSMRLWQGVLGLSPYEGIVSPAYTVLKIKNKDICSKFMSYLMKTPKMIIKFNRYSSGICSDTNNCKWPSFKEIEVKVPSSKKDQEKIVEILSCVDEVIELTEKEISKLQDLKKGMMQDLLTKGIGHTKFKDSPVGRIPESWEVLSLGELVDLNNGNSFKADDWKSSGLPIIRIQNLNGGSEFNYYDGEVEEKWHVLPGDLLFAWSGQRGKSFGASVWEGREGVLNQHIFKVLIKDPSILDQSFLYLKLLEIQEEIEKDAHGFKDSFMHVKKSDLVANFISLPSASEQSEISEKIDAVQKMIDLKEMKLEAKKILKKGLMQDLLTGKVRVK